MTEYSPEYLALRNALIVANACVKAGESVDILYYMKDLMGDKDVPNAYWIIKKILDDQ